MSLTPQSRALEFCAETALLIALFSVGLKMGRVPVATMRWILPVRLAVLTMLTTAGLVAFAAWKLLGLSPGYAVLLGGILAPTDPVLASGVQTEGGYTRAPAIRFGWRRRAKRRYRLSSRNARSRDAGFT